MRAIRPVPTEATASDTHELASGHFCYIAPPPHSAPIDPWRVDGAQAQVRHDVVFDEARFREYIGDDPELIVKVVRCFLADTPGRLDGMRAGMKAGDATKVTRVAHSLKGSIGFFAAAPALEAAREMEQRARTGDLEGLAGPAAALEHELVRLTAALEGFLAYKLLSRPQP